MAGKGLFSHDDVQGMLELVGTLTAMPADPILRRKYMLAALAKLVGGTAGIALCGSFEGPEQTLHTCSSACVGVPVRSQALITRYFQTGQPPDPKRSVLVAQKEALVTRSRREVLGDRDYYDSPHYREVRRPLGLDDYIYSCRRITHCAASHCVIEINRAAGQRPFGPREVRIVHAIRQHECMLHKVCGPALVRSPAAQLPPRLQSVLPSLLAGQSEKSIAQQLGLSRHTVHQYTKIIYHKLGVGSRPELLLRWFRQEAPAS